MTCHNCGTPLEGGQLKWCSPSCRGKAHRRGATGSLPDRSGRLSVIEKLLADNNIDLAEIGAIEKIRLNEWEGLTKDDNGDAKVTKMRAASLIISPKWESGPEWPVVQQAKPTVVRLPKAQARKRTKTKTAVILPDPQVGYRQLRDGTLDPFHDEAAMSAALAVVAELQPDRIVNLGDLLDFPGFGKYEQEQSWATTTQACIDRAHEFLVAQRGIAPRAAIDLLAGNHDERLPMAIQANAAAAFGITRAKMPDSWPVLSVPHLLRVDDLGIDYHPGYPANEVWINDRLVCRHAPARMTSVSSSAAKSAEEERVSCIFGHIHRLELIHRTRPKRDGFSQILQASAGCLCRIDGAVPGRNSGIDLHGRPLLAYRDNWQQGLGVVTYEEGDSPFNVELVPIIQGVAYFRGNTYRG